MSLGTFASFISVEILARQPTKAFKESRRSEKLLHRQLAKYLVYRCRSLQSANPVLPQFVCGMAKRFMHSIEDDSETMRDHFISAISYAIGRHPIAVDKLIWNPRPVTMAKTFGSGGAEHDVAAAIAIGNTEVFLAVVVGKDQCLFKKSVIFGNPLAMAAGKGEIRMVEAVLDVAMRFPPEDELARHQFLASGIDCALDRSFYDTAIFILLRYREYLGSAFPLPRPSFDNWIIAAINGNSEDVVKVILEINSDQRRIQSSVLQKFIIRLRGSPLIKQMLNTGRTNMKPAFKRRWSTKFLDDAARAHNVDAVRGFSIMAQILMAMNMYVAPSTTIR
jgi:hypothetical protein